MDRFINTNIEQQSIYEIYRACRLCGAGAGYKMPIIQNVVDLDGREVELKQKIQECVQIEVHQNDKMPPLICELCVDKVNDFYEFLEMCRQTNKRTRLRLGLPPQRLASGASDAGDCILGLTEPVYIKEDSVNSISKNSNKPYKGKSKVSNNKVKIQLPESCRDTRARRSSPPNFKRTTRGSVSSPQDAKSKAKSHNQPKNSEHQDKKNATPLKSILKKGSKVEEDSLLIPRSKRCRQKETVKELQHKRVKIELTPSPRSQRSAKTSQQHDSHKCGVCGKSFQSVKSLSNHSRIHTAPTTHKESPAKSKTTSVRLRDLKKESIIETPSKYGKCCKCDVAINRKYLKKHEDGCRIKKRSYDDVIVKPEVRKKLRHVQVRVARCDALLTAQDSCTTYNISREYGLDTACVYPYISSVRSLRIKTEPDPDGMVSIDDRIRDEFGSGENFAHWDSDYSSDDDGASSAPAKKRKVDSLTALTLKTIFSPKCLGKVPRRHRRVKTENLSDNGTGAIDLIESFEDIDELERINDNVNDEVANFDDLLRDDDLGESQLNPTDAVIDKDNLEEEGSGNNEECITIGKDRVADEPLETDDKQNVSRIDEVDDEIRVLSDHDGTDGQIKVNSDDETAIESRSCSDSERINKEETNNSYINNLDESTNVSTDNISLGKSEEDILLNDEDSISVTEDKYFENGAVEQCLKDLELNSETEDSMKVDDEIVEPEVNTEVACAQVNGECNTGVQLLNTEDLSGTTQRNEGSPKNESEINTEEEIERSNENVDVISEDSKGETKDMDSIDIDKIINESIEERSVENVKTEPVDVNTEAGGDEKEEEHSTVTGNGLKFNDSGEPKSESASVNVNDYKKDNHQNEQKGAYKLNMDDLDDISDAELDDCELMEALDAQIGEEKSSKVIEKDKITLEDLLPDKTSDIKPVDMEMLTEQFSFDA